MKHLHKITGILLIILATVVLCLTCINNQQSMMAFPLKVSFVGDYKIEDGDWNPITKDKFIAANQGNVTLKGFFQLEDPDGNVLGEVEEGMIVDLYFNHLAGDVFVEGEGFRAFDSENKIYGKSSCGEQWIAYMVPAGEVEIILKNPHSFGNENAVNEFLDSMMLYSSESIDQAVQQGNTERLIGFVILITSLGLLGIAIFSTLIQEIQSDMVWMLAFLLFFAGGYFILNSKNISLWSPLVIFNTTALLLCMMLYVIILMILMTKSFTSYLQKIGKAVPVIMGTVTGALLLSSLLKDVYLHDLLPYWTLALGISDILMLGCCLMSLKETKGKHRILLLFYILLLLAFHMDILGTIWGKWQGGFLSKILFFCLFVIALVIALKVIPSNIKSSIHEKELEVELQQSRISIMLSQIQPHFLYNSISAIRELCRQDPKRAFDALGVFSTYLRSNLDSLGSEKLIPFSKELAHIQAYLKLEQLRFGDELKVVYDIQKKDFCLPSLCVQPLVENAVKHGLCKKEGKGTLTLKTREIGDKILIEIQDDGIGFDVEKMHSAKDKNKHYGIENVSMRLKQKMNAEMTIDSELQKGTTVRILIDMQKEAL